MAGLGDSGAASGAVRAGRAFVELFAKDNSVYRSLDRLQARFRQIGQFMLKVGATTAIAGGVALKPAVETFVAFDDAIRMAIASTSDGAKNFDKLRDHALELGRTTSFTATKVAELMTELARGGFNSSEIVDMTGAVLNLARATGTDATNSAGVLAAAIRQFGLDAKDATHVADTLAAGANLSFTSVDALGESLKMVGPVAKTMNQSLDDTVAILGMLANLGIRGTEAGTAMRRLLTGLGANSKDFMDVFGVMSKDAAGNARPLVAVLDDVGKSVAGLGTADKAEKFEKLFGLLGITSAVAISENAKGVRELRDEIGQSGGVAARLAKEMDAGLGGSFRRLRGAAEGVAVSIGDSLAPALTFVSKTLSLAAAWVQQLIGDNRELVGQIAGGTIAVIAGGVALAGFGVVISSIAGGVAVFTTGIGAVVGVLGAVAGVLGAIASPAGLAAAGVAALAVSLVSGSEKGQAMVENLKAGFSEMLETGKAAWGGITAAIGKGDLKLAFAVAAAGLRLEWEKVVLYWTETWVNFKNGILNDLHEIALRIEGTVVWKKGEAAAEVTADVAAEFKGIVEDSMGMLVDTFASGFKVLGITGETIGFHGAPPESPPVGAPAGPPPKPISLIGLGLAPAFGDDVGQFLGKAVANAWNTELKVDPKVRDARARIAAADAAFKATLAEAMKPATELAPMPRPLADPNLAPMPREVAPAIAPPPRPVLDYAQIKGAFATPSARSQFGYADSFKDSPAKQQVDLLGQIVDEVAGLPAGLAIRLAQVFKPR